MEWRGRNNEAQADAAVVYGFDGGVRIGVLPATCKRGLHELRTSGYAATAVDGVLHVSCEPCRTQPHPDHYWRLTLEGEPPARAELDDEPYRGVEPQFIEVPASASGSA